MKYNPSKLANKYVNKGDITKEKAVRLIKELEKKHEKNPKKKLFTDLAELYLVCGLLDNAYKLLYEALLREPENPKVHRLLGDIHNYLENPTKAIPYFERALQLFEDYDQALVGCGTSYTKLKDFERGATYIQRALQINNSAVNNHSVGVLLYNAGYMEQAAAYLLKAHSLDKKNINFMVSYARVLYRLSRIEEAVLIYYRALKVEPDNKFLHSQIISTIKELGITNYDKTYKELTELLLTKPHIEHNNLSAIWCRMLLLDPEYYNFRETFHHKKYKDFVAALDLEETYRVLNQDFIIYGLRLVINVSIGFENFLKHFRRYMLEQAVKENQDNEKWSVFLCALAEHAFMNEYIIDVSEEEEGMIQTLKDKIGAFKSVESEAAIAALAVLGAYEPIYKQTENIIKHAVSMKEHFAKKSYVTTFITLQLEEPLTEEAIKKDIPIIGNISDLVSQKVREQYEENPYPRWRSISTEKDKTASVLFQKPYDILIAGCGTGKQILQDKQKYPNANILAVDLSRSSISYAKRKIQELEIEGVEFAHADILEIGNIGRKFDFVMCSGVLHHMNDPEAGLSVLTSLLKPNAHMNIGLYSEYAREKVVAYRNIVAEKKWPSTTKGIRALRNYVMGLDVKDPMRIVTTWRDYFTTSMCRDLLFHVQEHRYTFIQLKDMFDRHGLSFLAHSYLPVSIYEKFKLKFPNPNDYYDLEKWHEFEKEQRDSFAAMYQLWLCRKQDEANIRSAPALFSALQPKDAT